MKKDTTNLGNVIEIDEARIQDHLGELVRGSVEETLNALLDAEADRLCNGARYERTRHAEIRGRGRTSASCRPRPGRWRRPDGNSALMLAAARLRHIAGTQWRSKRYLSMELLRDLDAPETHAA